MLEIDGSRYSGSGAIVRQAAAYCALTGRAVRVFNARALRPRPGLRPQHLLVVEAVRELIGGEAAGVHLGSKEFTLRPGRAGVQPPRGYVWDVGSAGSTTALALAVLPVLAFAPAPVSVEFRGGLFQDFAPSFFHLEHVVAPLLRRAGIDARVEMGRPGYVPRGGGILFLSVKPCAEALRPLVLDEARAASGVWGIALSSHLEDRRVSDRMAAAAREVLAAAGYEASIEARYDASALQPGAALALFADMGGGVRMGADRAGAPRRSSESVGRQAARELIEDLSSGAALDRHAADQVIPFAALAAGESRLRVPVITEHIESAAWLAGEFLGAEVRTRDNLVTVSGVGLRPRAPGAAAGCGLAQPLRSTRRAKP